MSILLILPFSDDIENMLNYFWRKHGGSTNKGTHWLLWDKLSMPKSVGEIFGEVFGMLNVLSKIIGNIMILVNVSQFGKIGSYLTIK